MRRLEIGWREGNGTNTRLCSSIGFDGVVAERLLAGRGGRGPLDLRNGKGPPAWRKGRRRCRQGATCHGHCHRFAREILWVGGRRRGQLGVFLPWLPVSGDYSGLQAHRWWGLRDFFDFQLWAGRQDKQPSTPKPMPTRSRDCPDRLPIIQSGCVQQTTTADVDRLSLLKQVPIRR